MIAIGRISIFLFVDMTLERSTTFTFSTGRDQRRVCILAIHFTESDGVIRVMSKIDLHSGRKIFGLESYT